MVVAPVGRGDTGSVPDTIALAEKALVTALDLPGLDAQTQDGQAPRSPAPGGLRLLDPVDLGGSARSRVFRCRVELDTGSRVEERAEGAGAAERLPATVIVKHFLADTGEFLRERVGLELCPRTPRLLAQDQDHRLIVMSDLGDLPTLADLLLGDDPDAAWAGARTWARALGQAAGESRSGVAEAEQRLARAEHRNGDADLRKGVDRLLEAAAARSDGPPTATAASATASTKAAIQAELAAALRLRTPGAAAIVSPTDTCPDNAVLGPDGWWFLDLEGTEVQHPALAAAYTMLPFATCWCVFDPPPGLTDLLRTEFSTGLAEHAPDIVVEPGWSTAVRQACALYLVLLTGWLWQSTVEGRLSVGPEGLSPSYRQLMVSRWRWGALHLRDDFPQLAAVLGDAAAWALETWGLDVELGGYRAFR